MTNIDCVAELLAQGSLTGHEANDAWALLIPLIQTIATRVARKTLALRLQDEFVAYAPSLIFERIKKYTRDRGEFSAWAWRVLHNSAKDYLRKNKTRSPEQCLQRDDFSLDVPDHGQARQDSLRTVRRRARRHARRLLLGLRLIRWSPSRRTRIDYFAVTMVDIRLDASARAARAYRKEREALSSKDTSWQVTWCAEWIERLIPWELNEQAARFSRMDRQYRRCGES